MLKLSNIRLSLALLGLFLVLLPLRAETVTVSLNRNPVYDIDFAEYVATLRDGSVIGFNGDMYHEIFSFCGAISKSASLAIPDTVVFDGVGYLVRDCCSSSGELDLRNCPNLDKLVLPKCVMNIASSIPQKIRDIVLQSDTPPELVSEALPVTSTVWVPRSAYPTYIKKCGTNNWNALQPIRYDGYVSKVHTVNVTDAGTFGYRLLAQIDQWVDVEELVITGTLNADDMSYFSRLLALRKLDLSQANITKIGGCSGLKRLQSVILPSTVTAVEKNAFEGCSSLKDIELTNVREIDDYAFRACSLLNFSQLNFDNVEILGRNAFEDCVTLQNVELPSVKSLGEGCFSGCISLRSIDLPEDLKSIPLLCFCRTQLDDIKFPRELRSIGGSAFSGTNLSSVKLPEGLQRVEYSAFSGCSVTELTIPSTIQTFEGGFKYSSLKDIYCYAAVPFESEAFSEVTSTVLHVPAFGVSAYRLHKDWGAFSQILPMEEDVTDVSIYQDYTLFQKAGLADNANLTIGYLTQGDWNTSPFPGHLTVDAGEKINLGTYTHNQNLERKASNTTLIAKSEVEAKEVTMNLTVLSGKWNFISFPFDVNVDDIEMPDSVLWVIRRYSGRDRASSSGNTWQSMADGTVLNAGEGYILHCTKEGDEWYGSNNGIVMTVHAVNNANKNGAFETQDAMVSLKEYPSEFAHNRSWNLVGNPYLSYYDIRMMEFESPITVWNGYGYTAYSPLDDEYTLCPNEAFFVQCPSGSSSMKFDAQGRTHECPENTESLSSRAAHSRAALSSGRSVLDVTLSGNGYKDRARLVLNEEASAEYEMNRDASKFMSNQADVPQVYLVDNGCRYAIDERPAGDGCYALGAYFGEEGEYRISLDARNLHEKVMLTDLRTGKTVNLLDDEYDFSANAGADEQRFLLTIHGEQTSIGHTSEKVPAESPIYNIAGQRASEKEKGILIVDGKKLLNK